MTGVVTGFLAIFRNWLKPNQTSQTGTDASTIPTKQANNLGNGAIAQVGNAASNHAVVVGGNVNGNITIEHHESAADHSHSLRACYLRRVLADCGELKLDAVDREAAGQGGKASLSLKAVYTALLTRTPRRGDADHLTARRLAAPDEPPLSALEQLDRQQRLVLLGEPGSGKSTFVNFVALCLAGEGLHDADINLRYLTQALPDEEGKDTAKPQAWSHGALLPLRVILRDFAARGLPQPGQAAHGPQLWAFVEAELKACDLAEYAPHLKQELRDKGGLILLDGLDEVPEAETRRGQVKQAIEEFCKTYSLCRVLLTSRTYAYQQQGWQLSGFTQAELLPLGDGQIKRFIVRWYAHMAGLQRIKPENAEGRAVLLRQAIFSQPRLRELAERPLLLTLMASLHAWRGGDLPDRRERLYAEAVDLLLYLWEQRRLTRDQKGNIELLQPSVAEYLGSDKEQVRKRLETLAYAAHAAQAGLTGTADIAEDGLVAQLLAIADNPDAKPKRLVEYLRDRAGLLTARGVGVYTFVHRTFQEYLAACHLTDDDYPDHIAELARNDPDRWREVALLAGAKAGSGTKSAVWSLADELCCLAPHEHGTVDDEWGALLAGQLLIESADLAAPSTANRAKLDRIKAWLVRVMGGSGLVARERVVAGDLLASLGDPRPEATEVDRMQLCWIPAGDFLMGSDDIDKLACKAEKPQHKCSIPYGYWLARFPVTAAQFRLFLEQTNTQPGDPDCLKGPSNHPVVYVSWHEAIGFCEWLTGRWQSKGWLPDGWTVTLPSEAEWEKAARGGLEIPVKSQIQPPPFAAEPLILQANGSPSRIYPWGGSEADPERMNFDGTGILRTSAVGSFPRGATPYGNEEMSGNVWEWTRSVYAGYPYPEQGTKRQQRKDLKAGGRRVLRGGAFYNHQNLVRCAFRSSPVPDLRNNFNGFRIVVSPFL
jgi:formylglycine-generating enzyme required for sulfatase activity/energy-coupling factor transporter ATP-binding protein EcfA2